MKPGRRGEAQACRLDPGLCAHQVRLLAAPIDRDPGRAFRLHQTARLLEVGPRPFMIGCALQGGDSGVTRRLHFRISQRKAADLLHQSPMLPRDPGKAIGKLRLVDRLLVQNFEEPGDGFDRDAAVAGEDRAQPDKQHHAISGRGRRGKRHQPCDLLGRQAAENPQGRCRRRSLRRTSSWPPRARRAAAAGPAMPPPHSQSARRKARVAGSCLTPLRSFRRMAAILRSKTSPNL